jgi:hypothetical protein
MDADARYASRKWIAFWSLEVIWFLVCLFLFVKANTFEQAQLAVSTYAEWALYMLGTYCTANVLQFAAGRLNVQAKP